MTRRPAIAVIGAGNVATHLARALARDSQVVAVCSPTPGHALAIADTIAGCRGVTSLAELPTDADFYLIAVNDDAVAKVAAAMPRVAGTVMHTSGSVPASVLAPASQSYGVFYPLQTFSRNADVDISRVPFFTEGSDEATLGRIDSLARTLSDHVYHADSQKRSVLHVAAVMACNFANVLWDCAADILSGAGYPLTVFEPLLEVTLSKAMSAGPRQAQTGPAKRGDKAVIDSHIKALPPELKPIYRLLTDEIIRRHSTSQQ